MSAPFDLVIRGGTVADGLGSPLARADIAVRSGRIVQVGKIEQKGSEEIDAEGLVVTPGFVDIHTHYDGQAIWDERFAPSSWHGVTTVVMGNCGVGFAPVKSEDRERLIELMEGVEDIPGAALHEGLDWRWESFADFLDALERKPHDIDFAAYLPHAALRMYVMGERASRMEPATEDDRAQMRALTERAVRAGAIGFSSSRSLNHRTVRGAPTPSLHASEAELTAIALGLKDAGRGVLQMITDFDSEDVDAEFSLLRRVMEVSGRPLTFSLMQKHSNVDGWKRVLELTARAVADGLSMTAQVAPRGVGTLLGLQGSRNVFSECPSYRAISARPLPQRLEALQDARLRKVLVRELREHADTPLGTRLTQFDNIFLFGDPPDYDPGEHRSLAAIAARKGQDPAEVAYDELVRDGGSGMLYSPFANYASKSLDACAEMIAHPNTVMGLGDGGAHVGYITDSGFPTYLLAHWRGRFEFAWLVKRQTSDTARAVGLLDRGIIAPGMKADLNIIDPGRLAIAAPHVQADLPKGGSRLMQRAQGYVATIVSGKTVYRAGKATGELPGRLVRGPQAAPTGDVDSKEANLVTGH